MKIAILGYGTVGSGVYEIITNGNTEELKKLEVKSVFARSRDKMHLATDDINEIINDEEISVVVECLGGLNPAYDFIKRSLENGKHVVTANKAVAAKYLDEFVELAEKNNVKFIFEASVGGGIPWLVNLERTRRVDDVKRVYGIFNGTSNFILDNMYRNDQEFDSTLKTAQDLGYAEADPTADVEGLDAARKLAILASISFNRRIFFEDVTVEGITKIDTEDISFGKEFGYNIKLIGIAKESSKGLSLNVYPAFVPLTHPLASVRGSYNAIYIKGNGIDDAMFYGRGAGSLPTGSSVVSDIMEVAKNVAFESTGRFKPFYFDQKNIYSPGKIQSSYYMRLAVDNKTGVLAKIATKLAEQKISVLSIVQRNKDPETAVLAIVTSKCPHSYILNLIDSFNSLRSVKDVCSVIRIMEA